MNCLDLNEHALAEFQQYEEEMVLLTEISGVRNNKHTKALLECYSVN